MFRRPANCPCSSKLCGFEQKPGPSLRLISPAVEKSRGGVDEQALRQGSVPRMPNRATDARKLLLNRDARVTPGATRAFANRRTGHEHDEKGRSGRPLGGG